MTWLKFSRMDLEIWKLILVIEQTRVQYGIFLFDVWIPELDDHEAEVLLIVYY